MTEQRDYGEPHDKPRQHEWRDTSIYAPWYALLDIVTMLYELIAVVRPGNLNHVKEIARVTGQQILASSGVIRGMKNWGQFDLPRPTTRHQTQHRQGHYFVMQFDAPVRAQQDVRRFLSLDPRMIRFSVVKIGDKMGGINGAIEEVDGQIPWNGGGSAPFDDHRHRSM